MAAKAVKPKSPRSKAAKANKTKAEREEWCRLLKTESAKTKKENAKIKKAKACKKPKKAKACKKPKKAKACKPRRRRRVCRPCDYDDLDIPLQSYSSEDPLVQNMQDAENVQFSDVLQDAELVQFLLPGGPVGGVDETSSRDQAAEAGAPVGGVDGTSTRDQAADAAAREAARVQREETEARARTELEAEERAGDLVRKARKAKIAARKAQALEHAAREAKTATIEAQAREHAAEAQAAETARAAEVAAAEKRAGESLLSKLKFWGRKKKDAAEEEAAAGDGRTRGPVQSAEEAATEAQAIAARTAAREAIAAGLAAQTAAQPQQSDGGVAFESLKQSLGELSGILSGISGGSSIVNTMFKGEVRWAQTRDCDMSNYALGEGDSRCGLTKVRKANTLERLDFEDMIGHSDTVPWVSNSNKFSVRSGEIVAHLLRAMAAEVNKGGIEAGNDAHLFATMRFKFLWITVLPKKLGPDAQTSLKATLAIVKQLNGSVPRGYRNDNPEDELSYMAIVDGMLGDYASVTSHKYGDVEFAHDALSGSMDDATDSLRQMQLIYMAGKQSNLFTDATFAATMDYIRTWRLKGDTVVLGRKKGLSKKAFGMLLMAITSWVAFHDSINKEDISGGEESRRAAWQTIESMFNNFDWRQLGNDVMLPIQAQFMRVGDVLSNALSAAHDAAAAAARGIAGGAAAAAGAAGRGSGSVPGSVPGSGPGSGPGSVPGSGPGSGPGSVPGSVPLEPEGVSPVESFDSVLRGVQGVSALDDGGVSAVDTALFDNALETAMNAWKTITSGVDNFAVFAQIRLSAIDGSTVRGALSAAAGWHTPALDQLDQLPTDVLNAITQNGETPIFDVDWADQFAVDWGNEESFAQGVEGPRRRQAISSPHPFQQLPQSPADQGLFGGGQIEGVPLLEFSPSVGHTQPERDPSSPGVAQGMPSHDHLNANNGPQNYVPPQTFLPQPGLLGLA